MIRFTDILKDHNVPYIESGHEHCRAGWVQLDCPYCSPSSQHWRLGYNISGKYLNCWACGSKWIVQVLALLTDLSYKQVKDLVSNVESEKAPEIKRGKLERPKGVGELLSQHINYLFQRGFNYKKLSTLWDIKGIGRFSKFHKWRIYIPIHFRGEEVSWTTRSISDNHSTRYRAAEPQQEAINHHHLLYGGDYVRHSAIIVEGPTDVWRFGPGAVATMTTSYTSAQVRRIADFNRRIICFDNEPHAIRRAGELCDLLECFPGETIRVTLDSKDVDTASKREIKRLRRLFLS